MLLRSQTLISELPFLKSCLSFTLRAAITIKPTEILLIILETFLCDMSWEKSLSICETDEVKIPLASISKHKQVEHIQAFAAGEGLQKTVFFTAYRENQKKNNYLSK